MNLAKIKAEMAVTYASHFIGTPYKWGGNNPFDGFDCSGFVQWALQSVGLSKDDRSAQDLFNYLRGAGTPSDTVQPGAVLFYGKSPQYITHVAIANSPYTILEAGGGGAETKTLADCKKSGACVRQRLYNYRKDLVAMIIPNYENL